MLLWSSWGKVEMDLVEEIRRVMNNVDLKVYIVFELSIGKVFFVRKLCWGKRKNFYLWYYKEI